MAWAQFASNIYGWGNGPTNPPQDLKDAKAVSAGIAFGLAIRTDGTVVAWGDNSVGQLNAPAGLRNVRAVAAEMLTVWH